MDYFFVLNLLVLILYLNNHRQSIHNSKTALTYTKQNFFGFLSFHNVFMVIDRPNLKDELYVQLYKQTTNNPNLYEFILLILTKPVHPVLKVGSLSALHAAAFHQVNNFFLTSKAG